MSNTYFNISDKLRLYEFDGMLDQYGDAAAAYSLRKLRNGYTGDAIRVRRSSDNTERDMGFYDNDLDTAALLNWVNEEILHFDADLNDPTGWVFNGATMGAGSIDFTNSNSTLGAYKGYGAIPYEKVRVTFTIANYVSGKISWANYGGGAQDAEWKTADGTYVKERVLWSGNQNWGFWTSDGFTGSITEFRVEIIGSNGLVQTWYDQSANANHAVQNTDSAQPKIVDAGTLVTDNGNPSIVFDGVDDFLKSTLPGIPEGTDHTVSAVTNHKGAIGCYFETGKLYNGRYFNADNTGYYSALSINGTYNYISSLNANFTTNQQVNVISVATNNATNYDVYLNNTSETGTRTSSVPSGTDETYIGQGNRPGSEKWWTGDIQEIVFWSVNQTNSVDNIEQNTNTYYSIY